MSDFRHPFRVLAESILSAGRITESSTDGDEGFIPADVEGRVAEDEILALAHLLGLKSVADPAFDGGDDYAWIIYKPSVEPKVKAALHKFETGGYDESGEDAEPWEDMWEDMPDKHSCMLLLWDWKWFHKDDAEGTAGAFRNLGFKVTETKNGYKVTK